MRIPPPKKVVEFDPEYVRDISVVVYKDRLGPDAVERMLDKDNDGGKKLRNRASAYDTLTRVYLRLLKNQ